MYLWLMAPGAQASVSSCITSAILKWPHYTLDMVISSFKAQIFLEALLQGQP